MDQEEVIRTLLEDRRRLCSIAFAVTTDFSTAEDHFQDLVIKAVQRLETFENGDHLQRWAVTAIRNAAIDQVRQSSTRTRLLSELAYQRLSSHRAQIGSVAAESDQQDALAQCLEDLGESERDLLHRRYQRGESGEEIARALGLSTDAIYKRLSRLHRQLRRSLAASLSPTPTTPSQT